MQVSWDEMLKLLDAARHSQLIRYADNATDKHTLDLLTFRLRGSGRMW